MKNTIESEKGYRAFRLVEVDTDGINLKYSGFMKLFSGGALIMVAEERTIEEFAKEKQCNECFAFFEIFTTMRGNQFIYWGDTECGKDYLTRIDYIKYTKSEIERIVNG